jgi:hypothetical protein
MNRNSFERGERQNRFVRSLSAPGSHTRYYATALAATVGMIGLFFLVGWLIHRLSGGAFGFLGSGTSELAINPETGQPFYRPGGLLLAYYMVGFGFLLVHYLHDGLFFFRTRYLVTRRH